MPRRLVPRVERACVVCGRAFVVRLAVVRSGKGRLCSLSCVRIYTGRLNTGPRNPRWKGGGISPSGYKRINVKGRRIFEHRVVVQTRLGRELTQTEVVHHKNGNKLDNSPENLAVVSPSEHAHLHRGPDHWLYARPRCGKLTAKGRPCRAVTPCPTHDGGIYPERFRSGPWCGAMTRGHERAGQPCRRPVPCGYHS